jgi:glycosyltransferase involved in cell wall biosynthesis
MKDILVSCLCVTERRPAFMPWLLWCFDRQIWSRRELVIVDSSPEPLQIAARDDIRVVITTPGTDVAEKRNVALQEARGELITWFDDDDWQHPYKLTRLVEVLRDGALYAGSCSGWFVDLFASRCVLYHGLAGRIVFNSAGFRREAVLPFRFRDGLRGAEDTAWLRELSKRHCRKATILDREDMFFWLCHEDNLSNPARRRRFPERLKTLEKRIGSEAWADTSDALDALRWRLQSQDLSD